MYMPVAILTIALKSIQISADISEEQGVLVLDTDNFNDAIEENEFILVEFYAPWCGHCKNLAPEYAKAAAELDLKKSEIKLAKIDATENEGIAKKFGIAGYPTMKFFRSGQAIPYNGGRRGSDIVNWVEKKTTPLTVKLNSAEETKSLIESNDVNIIAFFKDKEHDGIMSIMTLAEELDGYSYKFGITNSPEALSDYNIENEGIYMFKDFDDKPAKYKGKSFLTIDIKFFIHDHALPLLVEFNPRLPPRIFASINPSLHLIVSSKSEEYDSQKELAMKMAQEYKRKVNIVLVDIDNEKNTGFADYFLGFKKTDAPAMRLVHGMQDKYDPAYGSLTEEKIREYISERIGGKGVGWTKSEKAPDDWDKHPVKVLVAKNFHEVVNTNKFAFVEFYAPWCGHCKALAPIWEELGEIFKDSQDIIIAKIDATVNQIDSVRIPGYPSLLLFQGAMMNTPFKGERTLEGILHFLKDQGVKVKDQKDEL